jgi:hypothetical protein
MEIPLDVVAAVGVGEGNGPAAAVVAAPARGARFGAEVEGFQGVRVRRGVLGTSCCGRTGPSWVRGLGGTWWVVIGLE